MSISQFIASFLVGYITSWQLSLVLTAMLPFLLIGGWCMAKAMQQGSSINREAYEKAGGIAEEVLYQIRTVASFVNFEYESNHYRYHINKSMNAGIKSGYKAGFGIGFIIFIVYASYALAVGYGSYLISSESVNANNARVFGSGDVITVLFSIIFGCLSLGQATPYIRAIYEAMMAASDFFNLMNRKPKIDLTHSTLKPNKDSLRGSLCFNNVIFSYPSVPEKQILKQFCHVFEPNKKTAIVGESGCGKSTILSLIERFYDPQGGVIAIDNHDIRSLDLKYWRSLIGYVPQEPVLFNTSIKNNIIFGRSGITEDDIHMACNKAYADEFIKNVGLDYVVGIKGSKLSGGQKQRIAIARAILTKPKLLILDEATSALDNKSETEVQKALDIVSRGITTILIAHKIETIMNSDTIIFLKDGQIAEHGTHEELIALQGHYYNMALTQSEKQKKELEREREEKAREEISRIHEAELENSMEEREEMPNGAKGDFIEEQEEGVLQSIQKSPTKTPSVRKTPTMKHDSIVLQEMVNNENLSKNKRFTNILERKPSSMDKRLFTPITHRKLSSGNVELNTFKRMDTESRKTEVKDESPLAKDDELKIDPKKFSELRRRLLGLLSDHKLFVAGAAFAASCNGAVWPIYGILLADSIGTLADKNEVKQGGLNLAMMFVALAIAAGGILWMQK
jgi:ATP-binding cassette subfamily B (MDR/TAP) protein 1